jgi:2,5-diamino-6-(ribosylamino)-4(3H)-pyrimidinone 5'-phosphate reductase
MERAEFRAVDLAEVHANLAAKRADQTRPYTVVNMVSSADGKATMGGRAGKIGTPIDRQVMRQVRAACDGLIYGAGTLRAEHVDPRVPPAAAEQRARQGRRPQPLPVVVSASGQVPLDNLFFRVAGEPPLIFTAEAAGKETITRLGTKGRVFVSGGAEVDLRQMMSILSAEFGLRMAVVEGGPALNYALLRDGLVDELLLTLAPKIVGGRRALSIVEGPELAPEEMPHLALLSVYRHESELFLRYRVLPSSAS